MKVFKYKLPAIDTTVQVELPEGAKVLHVADQGGSPHLWALVNPDAPTETHYFRVAATGADVARELEYVGTAVCFNGALLWHVFEDRSKT